MRRSPRSPLPVSRLQQTILSGEVLRGCSRQPVQNARHQIFPACPESASHPARQRPRCATTARPYARRTRFPPQCAARTCPRLPQRSVFNRLLLQPRDVDKFEIADVVKPQATLLARNLFQQTAVGGKPGGGGELVLRLREPREEPRVAEGRMVVAEPRALLLRRVPIAQQRAKVARLMESNAPSGSKEGNSGFGLIASSSAPTAKTTPQPSRIHTEIQRRRFIPLPPRCLPFSVE
jgi:hypothetical protein